MAFPEGRRLVIRSVSGDMTQPIVLWLLVLEPLEMQNLQNCVRNICWMSLLELPGDARSIAARAVVQDSVTHSHYRSL